MSRYPKTLRDVAKGTKGKRNGLTPRQRKFVNAYLLEPNATKAAIAAGYSADTAHSSGPRLLENVGIAQALAEATEQAAEKAIISKAELLTELKRIALVDIREAYDENGKLKPIKDIPEDTVRAIGGIETEELWEWEGSGDAREHVRTGDVRKVKFLDKTRAIELGMKHLGMLVDRQEVTHRVSLEALLEESMGAEE